MSEKLTQHLSTALLAGETLTDSDGNKHNLSSVMDYIYIIDYLCEKESSFSLQLTANIDNAVKQTQIIIERNIWVNYVIALYVDKHYQKLAQQHYQNIKEYDAELAND